jgi:hypothetical protein
VTDRDDDYEVSLVIFRSVDGRPVPIAGSVPIDLEDPTEPTGELLAALRSSTVHVSDDDGFTPEELSVVGGIPVPPAFRNSPWLDDSRPVIVGADGWGHIDRIPVRYHELTGLHIALPASDLDYDENG